MFWFFCCKAGGALSSSTRDQTHIPLHWKVESQPLDHQESPWAPSFHHPEKAMAPHSSTLAWKIPWTEEPGRLQSMGLLRVRHD